MKKELINQLAEKLKTFGYDVYISKDGRHGFYTDGRRVVSFGGCWNFCVTFSGNYKQSREHGTGWAIAEEQTDITAEQAESYIKAPVPSWVKNPKAVFTTPEQYLKPIMHQDL